MRPTPRPIRSRPLTGHRTAPRPAALAALGLAFAALPLTALPWSAARADAPRLDLIGEVTFPNDYSFGSTLVGGLSGIDYDPATGTYYAISDDQNAARGQRYYTLAIDLADGSLDAGDAVFTGVQAFDGVDPLVDPESVRVRDGKLYWTSEGNNDASGNLAPWVRVMGTDGADRGLLTDGGPKYAPGAGTGVRDNLAFESLTFSTDGKSLYTGTEAALIQDGAAATPSAGSPARILKLDAGSGLPTAEYVLMTDPVVDAPNPPGSFAVAGLVELLAWSDSELLALERSFSVGAPGTGHTAKIYLIDLSQATDVIGLASLAGETYTPAAKTLVLDLATLGMDLDNLEGMTFGPDLPSGNRSLILVSDNNFAVPGAPQFTQILAFEVVPAPAPAALLLTGLAGLALKRRPPKRP